MMWLTCFCWALLCAVAGGVRMALEVDTIGITLLIIAAVDLAAGTVIWAKERWLD